MGTEHDSDQPAISGNDDETTVETGAGPDQDAEPSLNAPPSPGRPDGLADEAGSGDEDGPEDGQGGGMARRPPADS